MKKIFFILLLTIIIQQSYAAPIFDLENIINPQPTIIAQYGAGGTCDTTGNIITCNTLEDVKVTNIYFTYQDGQIISTIGVKDDCENYCSTHQFKLEEPLSSGDYQLTITAENIKGKSTIDTIQFSLSDLMIKLESPKSGYKSTTPYDITLKTYYEVNDNEIAANVSCKYFLGETTKEYEELTRTFSTRGNLHTTQLSAPENNLSVRCVETNNGEIIRRANKLFHVGYDNTAPNIDFDTNPQYPESIKNFADPYGILYVNTSDTTYCELTDKDGTTEPISNFERDDYESYSIEHSKQIFFNNDIGVNVDYSNSMIGEPEFEITCYNKAEMLASQNAKFNISLQQIVLITPITPEDYAKPNSELKIYTNVEASCEYGFMNDNTYTKESDLASTNHLLHTKNMQLTANTDYSIKVICEPLIGNIDSGEEIIEFTIDDEAPTINISSEENICGNSLSATIEVEDNYQIDRIEWKLKQGTTEIDAENLTTTDPKYIHTISATTSSIGTYTWEIKAYDKAGNQLTKTQQVITKSGNSDECLGSDFIHYLNPLMGWSSTIPFDMIIETNREANCKYLGANLYDQYKRLNAENIYDNYALNMNKLTSTTFKNPNQFTEAYNSPSKFYFACEDLSNENNFVYGNILEFGFNDDKTSIFNEKATPDFVEDEASPFTIITAETDDDAVCWLSGGLNGIGSTLLFDNEDDSEVSTYSKNHSIKIEYEIGDKSQKEYVYTITCQNKINLRTNSDPVHVDVNFNADLTIKVLSPERYINTNSATIIVKPSVIGTCQYKTVDNETSEWRSMTGSNNEWSTTASSLTEKQHSMKVKCQGSEAPTEKTITFTVDQTDPNITITTPASVCVNETITVDFDVTDDSGIKYKNLSLSFEDGTELITNKKYKFKATLINEETSHKYDFKANAEDNAGNKVSKPFSIVVKDLATCNLCGNGVVDEGEECDGTNLSKEINCTNYSINNCVGCLVTKCENCPYTCTSDNNCVSSCATNTLCEADPDCTTSDEKQGSPNDKEGSDKNIESETCPYNCIENGVCEDGCANNFYCSYDPDCTNSGEEDGINIIGVILSILGLLVMGGCSYYLYYEYQNKTDNDQYNELISDNQNISNISSTSMPPPINPEIQQQIDEQRKAEVEAFKKHVQEKEINRRNQLSAFDDDQTNKKSTKQKSEFIPEEHEVYNETPEIEEEHDEFIPIEQLGHTEEKTKENIQKNKKVEKTFNELDNLIKEKDGKNE